MARKGTVVERIIAVSVGFIIYGVVYLVLYGVVGGDTVAGAVLGLLWLVSVTAGVISTFITANLILKYRK